MALSAVNEKVQVVSLVTIAGILAAAALHWLGPVMVPLILAVMLSYVLDPVVDLLCARLRFPRFVGVFSALLLGFAGLSLLGGLVSRSVRELATNADAYQNHIEELVGRVQSSPIFHSMEFDVGLLQDFVGALPVGAVIGQVTSTLLDGLSNTFLVLIFVIYLLQGQGSGQTRAPLAVQLEGRIKRYLSIKLLLSGVTGLLVGILLAVLGVELALVFGILAFILNFIPSVGSIIATLLPLPLVLVEPGSTVLDIVLVLALPGGVQVVVGNILEPKLLGDSLDLHPITVLLSLIFWGMLWGIPGMLLAAPITAVLKILFEHLEVTAPLGRLLAGDVNALFEGTGESAAPVAAPSEAESSTSEVS